MVDEATHGLPFVNDLSVALSSLPAADKASLVGLSVPSVRSWIATKAEEYLRYTLALHTMHNTLIQVHRLPVEMLFRIFIEAWQDRKSLCLTHVCRLWRSLLLDMPQFWALAIAGDEFRLPSDDKDPSDEDYLNAACVRSAPKTLSIRLSCISSRGHLQLITLADRITSLQLTIQGGDQLQWLWQVLHAGMPRLEDLAVCLSICLGVPAETVTGPHPLSAEKLPRLTRLTLPATLFPFSWRLVTIQEITLRSDIVNHHSHRPSRIQLDLVLEFLEYYPNLRMLEISDEAVVVSPHLHTRTVKFPTLNRLRVTAHPETVSIILSHLTFPLSAHIDIGIVSDPPEWDDDDDQDDWLSYPSKPWPQPDPFEDNPTLIAVVAPIDQVIIENGPSPAVHGYVDGAERLQVRYIGGEYNRCRESEVCLSNLFARANAQVSHVLLFTPPRLSRYSRPSDCPFSQTVLDAFPHLTHLSIRSPNPASCLISSSSQQYYSYSATPPPMPLLFLEDLTLGFETPRGDDSIAPLRRHDITADVADEFRQRCKVLAMYLRGRRLSRFEFFLYEEGCMSQDTAHFSHIDLAALNPELVEDGLGTLKALVGGTVVFSGYHFFTHTPEPPSRPY